MMRRSPVVIAAATLTSACIAQVFRLSSDGWPIWAAIGTVAGVAGGVMAVGYLALVIAGGRNRKLLRILKSADPSWPVFPVYYSRELHEELARIDPDVPARELLNLHGAVQITEAGLVIWSTRKHQPVEPSASATLEWDRVLFADHAVIEIEGSTHPGLQISIWTGPDESIELSVGVASQRLGAFFPSPHTRAQCLASIQARIDHADHRWESLES